MHFADLLAGLLKQKTLQHHIYHINESHNTTILLPIFYGEQEKKITSSSQPDFQREDESATSGKAGGLILWTAQSGILTHGFVNKQMQLIAILNTQPHSVAKSLVCPLQQTG